MRGDVGIVAPRAAAQALATPTGQSLSTTAPFIAARENGRLILWRINAFFAQSMRHYATEHSYAIPACDPPTRLSW